MQLRYTPKCTHQEYRENRAWANVVLPQCPFHGDKKCGIRRHGTYKRGPDQTPIARFYCPLAHRTVSALPDFYASNLPGMLDDIEEAVSTFETGRVEGKTVASIAQQLRPLSGLQSALRWLARRRRYARTALRALVATIPDTLRSHALSIRTAQMILMTCSVLVATREIGVDVITKTPWSSGLLPRGNVGYAYRIPVQHARGLIPPDE